MAATPVISSLQQELDESESRVFYGSTAESVALHVAAKERLPVDSVISVTALNDSERHFVVKRSARSSGLANGGQTLIADLDQSHEFGATHIDAPSAMDAAKLALTETQYIRSTTPLRMTVTNMNTGENHTFISSPSSPSA